MASEIKQIQSPYIELINQIPFEILKECVNEVKLSNSDDDIDNYKGFASWSVKYQMLRYAIQHLNKNNIRVPFLLDLASGRGNDLQKWTKIHQEDTRKERYKKHERDLSRVIGIEYDHKQVQEAIKRYRSLLAGAKKRKQNVPTVSYVEGSAYDPDLISKEIQKLKKDYKKNGKINLITCNFAIHYFFKTEEICNTFFKIISDNLNTNGLFLGTAPDGNVIDALFNLMCEKNKGYCEVKTNLYYIKKGKNYNRIRNRIYGREYDFKLETPYFESDVSTEYLVKKEVLENIARKFGLVPYAVIPNIAAISNLAYFPLSKRRYEIFICICGKKFPKKRFEKHKCENKKLVKTMTYYKRPLGIASLFFGFSFIKASPKLLHNIDNPVGIVIIPYRNSNENENETNDLKKDRSEQLVELLKHLPEDLDVIVVEQNDDEPFNRGLLLDLGVKFSSTSTPGSKKYNYFILHDVDLIPDEELKAYYYKYPVNPIHLGARGQRYSEDEDISTGMKMKDKHFLGGVLSISKEDFNKVNGYSFKKFKGWGGEDDSFRDRLLRHGIAYVKPSSGGVYDLEAIDWERKKELLDQNNLRSKNKRELVNQDKGDYKDDGIKQIKNFMYTVSKINDKFKDIRSDLKWIKTN